MRYGNSDTYARRNGLRGSRDWPRRADQSLVFHNIQAGLLGRPAPPEPPLGTRVAFMTRHFERAVRQRGEKLACTQFRKTIDWYAKSFGPCRPLRLAMKELSSRQHYYDLVGQFLAYRSQHPLFRGKNYPAGEAVPA